MTTSMTPVVRSRRPKGDSEDYGSHVHIHLKAAFGLIKKCMKDGLYMPAYVTAFSIVEDRLFAMYVVARRVIDGETEVRRNFRISLLKNADYLIKNGHLEKSIKPILDLEFELRNKRFHGAMWRLDEFNEENTTKIIDLARLLTDLRNKQRKKFGAGQK
jgi:hypothetical protein